MKPIRQKHLAGCAVACVAFLLEITYEQALLLFDNGEEKAKLKGFYCTEITQLLKNKNLIYQTKYVKTPDMHIYDPNTICYIKKSTAYPAGHFLIFKEGRWMDPWINFPNLPIKAGFRNKLPGIPQYIIVTK